MRRSQPPHRLLQSPRSVGDHHVVDLRLVAVLAAKRSFAVTMKRVVKPSPDEVFESEYLFVADFSGSMM